MHFLPVIPLPHHLQAIIFCVHRYPQVHFGGAADEWEIREEALTGQMWSGCLHPVYGSLRIPTRTWSGARLVQPPVKVLQIP